MIGFIICMVVLFLLLVALVFFWAKSKQVYKELKKDLNKEISDNAISLPKDH
jgi:regulatory protein YycI of two-component signal transduction system YycFG